MLGWRGTTNVRLIHNTIDQRGAPDSTAPIFSADNSRAMWAEDNLVAGGGYTLTIWDIAGQKSTVRNNKIVDGSWQYGPVRASCNEFWTGQQHRPNRRRVPGDLHGPPDAVQRLTI